MPRPRKKQVPIVICAVLAVALIIMGSVLLFGGAHRSLEPVKMLMKGLNNGDAQLIDQAIAPGCMGDINGNFSLSYYAGIGGYHWIYDFGNHKKLSARELDDVIDTFFYEYSNANISVGYKIEALVTADNGLMTAGESIDYYPEQGIWEITVVKFNGTWYVADIALIERWTATQG